MARVPDLHAHFAKMERRRRMRRILFWLACAVCFGAAIWWGTQMMLGLDLFAVHRTEVRGEKRVDAQDILALVRQEGIAGNFFRARLGEKNMLAWPSHLNKETLTALPLLTALEVMRDYRAHRIVVQVTEREPFGILCMKQKKESERPAECLWFDADGVLLGTAFEAEGPLIPVIVDYSGRTPRVGEIFIAPEVMKNILAIFEVVRSSEVDVREVELKDAILEEVAVATYEGPRLYFSMRAYPEGAAALLKSLSEKGEFRKLEYVDFRVPQRAYYK